MSGLKRKTQNDTVYLFVKHHCLCEEAKNQLDDFEKIETKNPRTGESVTKYIRPYESVEGFVTKIEWYDTKQQYDQRFLGYKLHIDAFGQPVVLDLPFKTRPYDAFAMFVENIDWKKPVKFSAWHDKKEDRTAFIARQDDAVVRRKYTKDNMGECPPAIFDEEDGWDFKAQRRWLKKRVDDVVIPAMARAQADREKQAAKQQAAAASATTDPKKKAFEMQHPDAPEYIDEADPFRDEIPF